MRYLPSSLLPLRNYAFWKMKACPLLTDGPSSFWASRPRTGPLALPLLPDSQFDLERILGHDPYATALPLGGLDNALMQFAADAHLFGVSV